MKAFYSDPTNIGSICEVIAGQSPKSSAYNIEGNGLPFYQGKKDFGLRYIYPAKKWTTQITKEAKAGDILMSVRAPVGPINEATETICIGRGLAAIRASEEIDKNYLWYGLLWLQPEIKGHEGAVFSSINKKGIEALKIPLPPLEEQKRIVAILDEAFEGLDRARAHTEANLQNAKELFQSYLSKVFSQKCEGWQELPLGEIAQLIDSLHKTPKYSNDGGYHMVRVTDIKDGEINFSKTKKVDEETFREFSKRHSPQIGDLVLSRVGSYGIPALVKTNEPFCLGQNTVFIIPTINSELLYYFLISPTSKKQVDSFVDGTTQPTISLKNIRKIVVSFPLLNEQADLVSHLDELSKRSKLLRNKYRSKLADLDDLRQSLLQKAFAGELT